MKRRSFLASILGLFGAGAVAAPKADLRMAYRDSVYAWRAVDNGELAMWKASEGGTWVRV